MLSAVIVPVPEVEHAVADLRDRHDPAAGWGVPAHVTVMFPFLPPDEIDAGVLDRLGAAVASVPRAVATFGRTAWFGTEVLWLAPDPSAVFTALTDAVTAAFPGYLPYGGEIEDVVAHVTIGYNTAAPEPPPAVLRRAEELVQALLPITAEVDEVELWWGTEAPGGWRRVESFPLGS